VPTRLHPGPSAQRFHRVTARQWLRHLTALQASRQLMVLQALRRLTALQASRRPAAPRRPHRALTARRRPGRLTARLRSRPLTARLRSRRLTARYGSRRATARLRFRWPMPRQTFRRPGAGADAEARPRTGRDRWLSVDQGPGRQRRALPRRASRGPGLAHVRGGAGQREPAVIPGTAAAVARLLGGRPGHGPAVVGPGHRPGHGTAGGAARRCGPGCWPLAPAGRGPDPEPVLDALGAR
jgi:hypothetical protein